MVRSKTDRKTNEQVDKDRSSNLGHIDIWLVRQIKKQKETDTWMDGWMDGWREKERERFNK